MMLITLFAKLCTNVCCFLYPAYASYKALSASPESSPEAMEQVERWLMYWAVVGTWTAIEAVVGWSFTWLPFYSVFKSGVFLYLSLPQSEGSSHIYRTHLAPFFTEHETDIDAFLFSLRSRVSTGLSGGVGWLWEKIKTQLNLALPKTPEQIGEHDGAQQYPQNVSQPPTLQDPASGAAQQLLGFVARYAGQYMPIALTALNAAAASTRGQTHTHTPTHGGVASTLPETMSMSIPRPNSQVSDPNLRSRAYQHATTSQQPGQSSSGLGQYTPPPKSSSIGSSSSRRSSHTIPHGLSQRGSEESMTSRSSGGGGGGQRWDPMSGYEQINRDEVRDEPVDAAGRPIMDKRRSSWFGWGGGGSESPDHHKAE